MAHFAAAFARAARAGDCLALSGDLGAGKTSFARAFIRALAGDDAVDVPSPTFTLVQTYATDPPVSHFDFYRISDPGEVDELGLTEALDDGIALIEWPERALDVLPDTVVRITLAETDGGATRTLTVAGPIAFAERLDAALAGR